MKLKHDYQDIKRAIFEGLLRKGISLIKLAVYFKDIQYTKVEGDFNRACTWVGFELNGLWRDIYYEIEHLGINDDHLKTMYRKFFTELKFNIQWGY